jgi:dTDP-4-dehydrorhamnose 3,5-epimerase
MILKKEEAMVFTGLSLHGAFEITLEKRKDNRGFFARTFCVAEFNAHGLESNYVQCNTSWNDKVGTLRGMHLQIDPYGEAKFVRCTHGAVYDVIVDFRKDSKTFLKWVGVELTEERRNAIYVPIGFAHGYQALRDNSEVFYMVSQVYMPDFERGYRWNDPAFAIKWPLKNPILSPKDAAHSNYSE